MILFVCQIINMLLNISIRYLLSYFIYLIYRSREMIFRRPVYGVFHFKSYKVCQSMQHQCSYDNILFWVQRGLQISFTGGHKPSLIKLKVVYAGHVPYGHNIGSPSRMLNTLLAPYIWVDRRTLWRSLFYIYIYIFFFFFRFFHILTVRLLYSIPTETCRWHEWNII